MTTLREMSLKVCDLMIAAGQAKSLYSVRIYKVDFVFGIKGPLSVNICKEYKFCSPSSRLKIST